MITRLGRKEGLNRQNRFASIFLELSQMFKAVQAFLVAIFILSLGSKAIANNGEDEFPLVQTENSDQASPFTSFTGKVTKNKVRMRLQPNLDSPILRELNRGELLVVVGEAEDFYSVEPLADTKAYVFRTFILDNIVEGNHVNVRLEPDLDSPIIAQLNSGDRIEGTISPINSKWLEITPPDTTRFYVSKEFVEKVGDVSMMAVIQRRKNEVERLYQSSYLMSQNELKKPFEQIDLKEVTNNLNKIIQGYSDFPEQGEKAKFLLATIQENYLQQKIKYLEAKSHSSEELQAKTSQLTADLQAKQERLQQLETKLSTQLPTLANSITLTKQENPQINEKMAAWLTIENALFETWKKENGDEQTQDHFYQDQAQDAVILSGVIEPYNRMVKNKPGDFVLVSKVTHLPMAYLYSTKVNLYDKIGQEVVIQAISRPNYHFAFPAYFVLSINP